MNTEELLARIESAIGTVMEDAEVDYPIGYNKGMHRVSWDEAAMRAALLAALAPVEPVAVAGKSRNPTTIDTMREAAKATLRRNDWHRTPGARLSLHQVAELMAAFGMEVDAGEIGCDWPQCGCCADAACRDAVFASPVAPTPSAEDDLVAAHRDVLVERKRQVEAEGWTPKHDDEHENGQMAYAAAWYAINAESHDYHDMVGVAAFQNSLNDHFKDEYSWCRWPWSMVWWKPKDRRGDLVKAGALILAEIERLDRIALRRAGGKP